MKKTLLLIGLVLVGFAQVGFAQPTQMTYGGIFDEVADRFGNKYQLSDLLITSRKKLGGSGTINAVPTQSCTAGYFKLYFAQGSLFDINSNARTTICQVYTDLSGMINSTLPSSVTINILCDDTPPSQAGFAATASGLYCYASALNQPNQGFIDNQIYKALVTGQNPFNNLVMSFVPGNGFYYGYVNVDSSAVWSYSLNSTSNGNTMDFYTVMLHEAIHNLGFHTYISSTGISALGSSTNYYTRYDNFLYGPTGAKVLVPTNSLCPSTGITYNSAQVPLSIISSATTGCFPLFTNCSNSIRFIYGPLDVNIYTPNCFANGSSLSHFEDMCPIPSTVNLGCANSTNLFLNNDKYYVMAENTQPGSCYIKRFPKDEEYFALCALGYNMNGSYGNNSIVAGSAVTYTSGNCSGNPVWGINDGIVNNNMVFTAMLTSTNAVAIPISGAGGVLSNDSPATNTLSCLDVVSGQATYSISGNLIIVTSTSTAGGLVVLRYYPQNSSSGETGGPVYIFAYFATSGCAVYNGCDIVPNHDFESYTPGLYNCGPMVATASVAPGVDCWTRHTGSPDYFLRNCTSALSGTLQYNLGVNTLSNSPTFNSFTGASPNNAVIGIAGNIGVGYSEALMCNLTTSLVPNQAYQLSVWLSNPIITNTTYINSLNVPVVFRIGTMPTALPISNFTTIASFTVPPGNFWTQYTYTFVFNSATPHSGMVVELDSFGTWTVSPSAYTAGMYGLIDELKIEPIPTATFVLPPGDCSLVTYSNLAQYSSPLPGHFWSPTAGIISTVSIAGGGVHYNFNTAGTFTNGPHLVAFTYTTATGCVKTLWQTVNFYPTYSLAISGPSLHCANWTTPAILTSTFSCGTCTPTYSWTGGPTTSSYAVTSSVTTAYTLTAFNGICRASKEWGLAILPACCDQSISPYGNFSPTLAPTVTGLTAINLNVSVPAGASSTLSGEVVFAPNVELVVGNNSTLVVNNAHLYACQNYMWKGIRVANGGKLVMNGQTYNNLVEDALIAVDAANQTTSSQNTILDIANTTFNKNHTAIYVSDFNQQVSPYPFSIRSNVFTCRNLPYTATTWPQTGTGAPAGAVPNLRYATATATAGLAAPFITASSLTLANLLPPHAGLSSQYGIKLNNVGSLTTYNFPIGDNTNPANFNLFDSQVEGVSILNSNTEIYNNVFQNTIDGQAWPGFGIRAGTNYSNVLKETSLVLTSTANPTGCNNRFYDCDYGVEAYNHAKVDLRYARFSSNQSNTAVATPSTAGACGLFVQSNRFQNYQITDNQFINLNVGLLNQSVSDYAFSTGTVSNYGFVYGTYSVSGNYFSSVTNMTNSVGTNYMNYGILFYGPNTGYSTTVGAPGFYTVAPYQPIRINYNSLWKVENGIHVIGHVNHGLSVRVGGNEILMHPSAITGVAQQGINVTSNNSSAVTINTVTGFSLNNALPHAGIYAANFNGSLTCNSVSNEPRGFELAAQFYDFKWFNNTMFNCARGMQGTSWGLTYNPPGIGAQGSSTVASDNYWSGTWNSTTQLQTWVDAFTNVTNSKIYTQAINGFSLDPSSCGVHTLGAVADSYNPPSHRPFASGPSGINCATISAFAVPSGWEDPNAIVFEDPDDPNIENAQFLLFLELLRNGDVLTINDTLADFFSEASVSNLGRIVDIENALVVMDYTEAQSLIDGFTPSTNYQDNFKIYYQLLLNYRLNGYLNSTEKSDLEVLCYQCPYSDGPAAFKARALHNLIYRTTPAYNDDNCIPVGYSGRPAKGFENTEESATFLQKLKNREAKTVKSTKIKNYLIYPNPAINQIWIKGCSEGENLLISIRDVSGRLLNEQNLMAHGLAFSLQLELHNGIYFVTLVNQRGERSVKKLIISK